MILDAIAALVGAIIEPLIAAVSVVLVGFLNLGILIAEAIGSIFVSNLKFKRISKRTRDPKRSDWIPTAVIFAIALLFIGYLQIKDREIQFVAVDGHSLPYAEVIVRTDNTERNERTDKVGRIDVPRFGLVSVSLMDPRYVEKTWTREELQPRLVAERTFLGSGLDKIANALLKPEKD